MFAIHGGGCFYLSLITRYVLLISIQSWDGDDGLSDIEVELEQKPVFNQRTLLRRHKSTEVSIPATLARST